MKRKSPLISFIIPAYGRWPYLQAALTSIYEQSVNDFEVIVVDDGSRPPLSTQIKQIFPAVAVLRLPKNHGPSVARNRGFQAAKGSFICWLDSDDQIEPEFVHRMTQVARETGRPVLCLASVMFATNFSLKKRWLQQLINFARNGVLRWKKWSNEGLLIPEAFFGATLSRMVFPRQVADRYHFNSALKNCEDWEFLLRVMETTSIHILPEKLVKFRFDQNSYSHIGRQLTKGRTYYQVIDMIPPQSRHQPLVKVFSLYTRWILGVQR